MEDIYFEAMVILPLLFKTVIHMSYYVVNFSDICCNYQYPLDNHHTKIIVFNIFRTIINPSIGGGL